MVSALPHVQLRDARAAGAARARVRGRRHEPAVDHGSLDGRPRRAGLRLAQSRRQYRSVSAFAPIVAPSQVPWGHKAFGNYLGADRGDWLDYDATHLVQQAPRTDTILIDQGLGDKFLAKQLQPALFEDACARSGQRLQLRRHAGYDHGYYFIQSFMADHLAWHARALSAG